MKRGFRRVLSFVVAAVVGLTPSLNVFALDESTANNFSQNDILFYDPNEVDCTSGPVNGNKVTIIGDSISVGAESQYSAQLSGADYADKTYNGVTYKITQVSKHFANDVTGNYSGLTIAKEMQTQGDLRDYVVFALGTNDPGAVTEALIDQLVDEIGTNHKIVLVTNRAYQNKINYDSNNAAIRAAAEKYSGKIAVADWAKKVEEAGDSVLKEDTSYYVHPDAQGSKLFVQLIVNALNSFNKTSGGGLTGDNKNYAGDQVWSEPELEAIKANQAIYEEAAKMYNFPWQVMAVLHSHETGLRRYNPSNGQGVYQLYSYTAGGTNANRFPPADSISEEEFRRQTIIAAEIVSKMAGDLNDPDNVKLLFFKYNGTSGTYKQKALDMGFTQAQANNGEGSAYVMNRYDAQRDPTSSQMSPYWPGRYVADGVYDPKSVSYGFGAFVQYEALAGGSSTCKSGAGGTIAETAMLLSWPYGTHSKSDPKPEYVTAMKEVNSYQQGCNSSGCAPIGASCDQFVGTVMRYSGADPEFPIFGPGVQEQYMKEHPDMYMEVDHKEDIANLEPGDIFVTSNNGNHIYLYVGDIDGKPGQASASFNDRTGEHFTSVYFSDNYGRDGGKRIYKVYRRINF